MYFWNATAWKKQRTTITCDYTMIAFRSLFATYSAARGLWVIVVIGVSLYFDFYGEIGIYNRFHVYDFLFTRQLRLLWDGVDVFRVTFVFVTFIVVTFIVVTFVTLELIGTQTQVTIVRVQIVKTLFEIIAFNVSIVGFAINFDSFRLFLLFIGFPPSNTTYSVFTTKPYIPFRYRFILKKCKISESIYYWKVI